MKIMKKRLGYVEGRIGVITCLIVFLEGEYEDNRREIIYLEILCIRYFSRCCSKIIFIF